MVSGRVPRTMGGGGHRPLADRREPARPADARASSREPRSSPTSASGTSKHEVHREVFDKMGELGFLGAPIPEQYGGAGMDYVSLGILCEEMERADTAFRVILSVHVGLNSLTLLQWGSEDQKQRCLRAAGAGREAGHVRPDRAGRRAPTPRTSPRRRAATATTTSSTAPRSGSAWRDIADHFLVFATRRPSQEAQGHHRVRGRARHARASRPAPSTASSASTPATPASSTSTTCACRSSQPRRRGRRGLHDRHERHRPGPLHGRDRRGRARAGLPRRVSLKYAHERKTFGEEIGRHQLVKQMIAQDGPGHRGRPAAVPAGGVAQEPRPAQHARDEPGQVVLHRPRRPVGARRDPDPRRVRLLERVPGGALPAQLARRRSSTRAPASCTR